MKMLLAALAAATLLNSVVAHADAFDDKARAAAAQQEANDAAKAHAASLKAINQNNAQMVRRVPRGAAITQCFNADAHMWRDEANGCNLGNVEWNGISVQICTDGYQYEYGDSALPPEIVMCHYRLPNGRDCEMYRNPSVKPVCF